MRKHYWDSDNYLESMGIARTKQQIELADIVLFIDPNDPAQKFSNLNVLTSKRALLNQLEQQ